MEINSPSGKHARTALEVIGKNFKELAKEHGPNTIASFTLIIGTGEPSSDSSICSLIDKVSKALKCLPTDGSVKMLVQMNDVSDFYQQLLRHVGDDLAEEQRKLQKSAELIVPDKRLVTPGEKA